jgi:PadR family transcriptional regulator, regulatory protein PadR
MESASRRRQNFFAIVKQMRRAFTGGLELVAMVAILRLDNRAYGVAISREIADVTGREVALASLYVTLDRLSSKGSVVSELGDPSPERGGRAKRYFSLTPQGRREVREAQRVLTSLWRDVPSLAGGRA